MRGRRITGITGQGIVRRRLGIDRMGRTSRVIDRHQIMVDVRRILEMVGGRLEMVVGLDRLETETGLGLPGMEMEAELDRRVMERGLGRPEMAGILVMGEEHVPLATVAGLDRLGMGEGAGPQRQLLGRHQHHALRLLLVLRRRLGQRLLRGLHRVVLLRADLIRGIRRVVRSRRSGLSRLVRDRVDLVGITMAQRRGRLVIAAKPALAAVGVREVNRNEIVQA